MRPQQIALIVQQGRQALAENRYADAREIYLHLLELDPAQPRAWLALSTIAQLQAQFRASVTSVRSAASAWKKADSQQFIAEVCMRLLVLGEYETVVDLMMSADWADPILLRHSMGLVQYLGLAEQHESALSLADFTMKQAAVPPASLWFARANALRYLGRSVEATESYERCIAQDPLHAEAHWSLAQHQVCAVLGSRISRIRKSIAHTNPQSDDAIYLQFALFKEYEDVGDIPAAWNALEQGAQLKRQRVQLNEAVMAENYRHLEKHCNAEFLAKKATKNNSNTPVPIFIVGLPRSGTTLLERVLSNHAQVKSAGELNDFPMQFSWEIDQFTSESIGSAGIIAADNLDYAALGEGYRQRTAWRAQGAAYVIDKLPNNLVYAGYIHKALPEAKIICLRRNAMDSCFSTYKHLFSGGAYSYSYGLTEMARHYQRFSNLVEHWQSSMPDCFHVIDYENLVQQPLDTIRSLTAVCGLRFDPNMVDIRNNTAASATASATQVREQIHDRHIGGWKQYAANLGLLEAVLSSDF